MRALAWPCRLSMAPFSCATPRLLRPSATGAAFEDGSGGSALAQVMQGVRFRDGEPLHAAEDWAAA